MIARQAASRHDTAHVRMPNQCLVPGVEDAQHTDLGTHVAWVGSDLPRRRGTDLKEPCVQTCAVPIGERQEPMQEREDDVDVWHAEELVLAGVEPARTRRTPSTRPVRTSVPAHSFGASPTVRVIGMNATETPSMNASKHKATGPARAVASTCTRRIDEGARRY